MKLISFSVNSVFITSPYAAFCLPDGRYSILIRIYSSCQSFASIPFQGTTKLIRLLSSNVIKMLEGFFQIAVVELNIPVFESLHCMPGNLFHLNVVRCDYRIT